QLPHPRRRHHARPCASGHAHLHLTPMRTQTAGVWPAAILKSIKGASARSVNKLTGASGPVWREESFDHALRSQESMKEKLEYIREKPGRGGLGSQGQRLPLALGRAVSNLNNAHVGRHSCPKETGGVATPFRGTAPAERSSWKLA